MSIHPLSIDERQRIFGPINYKVCPVPENPENISILGDWVAKNLVVVDLPWSNDGAKRLRVQFHQKAANPLLNWFEEMRQLGLLSLLLTFDGTFCPRLIRGGHTLSNHAFGTAIDLNAKYNALGLVPMPEGLTGSVIPIVAVAEKHGFFWGGNYQKRKDGMHFEYSVDLDAVPA